MKGFAKINLSEETIKGMSEIVGVADEFYQSAYSPDYKVKKRLSFYFSLLEL